MPRPPTPPPSADHARIEPRLIDGIRRMGLEPVPAQCRQFLSYIDLLLHWAEKINLTAITDPDGIIDRHFCDSLALWPALGMTTPSTLPGTNRLLDIGSGAGFPGVPLKIMAPQIGLTLLEPRQKRAAFLQVLIATLGCSQSQVVTGLSDLPAGTLYDWIVARGVGRPDALIAQTIDFLAPHGCFAFYLSERQSTSALQQLSGWQVTNYPYQLPLSATDHRLILLRRLY
ncbi:MAG: 16S rRNA (guanine(527)-N(7))-methyltransferase RsmG [Nitrospirae bacterium]|nr:16S rRNA (guanine(527)-N(7))-methyltransferase RsmG [Nitrospirota bacterium]